MAHKLMVCGLPLTDFGRQDAHVVTSSAGMSY